MLGRLIIEDVRPRTPGGYPAKALVGDRVVVSADIYREGHDLLAARVRWRPSSGAWSTAPMALDVNDRWEGELVTEEIGAHEVQIEAWTDRFATWRHDVELKAAADKDDSLATEIEEGALLIDRLAKKAAKEARPTLRSAVERLRDTGRSRDDRLNAGLDDHVAALLEGVVDDIDLTRSAKLPLWVDRERAGVGAWYELFPRSEGGFAGAQKRLPAIAAMGFDVVYLPPVHPIGMTYRKGPNNTLVAGPEDVGSPWAIGGEEGGHTDLHPELGDMTAFDDFVAEAESNGLEVALDYALQCSPDHPWVREHPEWFHHRPDGTIKYAENPPKKYQDIYPINFWPERDADRKALWQACKDIFEHWLSHGVRIFRVDNPHTKPFAFWEWVIPAIQAEHPDVIFLAEAFTRPKMMAKLAEVGFSQSYSYFTWRTARWELVEYLTELSAEPIVDYMRPSFWPNTPDILAGPLRDGPPAAFRLRFLLAAGMTPTYGMYSGYELCENEPASSTNEEYLHSEKYEVREREWDQPGSLAPFITLVNQARRRHPAFRQLRTIRFHDATDEAIIAWSKSDPVTGDVVLCVANLDPFGWHEASLSLDLPALGLDWNDTYEVVDELSGATYTWSGAHPYVRLDPAEQPGHIFSIRPRSVTIDFNDARWYQKAVFYEVLTRGFFDANGDGTGDLKGLTEKLDYLEWLGVDCLWLLPFYQSPLRDGGYDISDFFTVLPAYGDVKDAANLIEESHRRGIRIIADMVMNHTSDQHPWFQESRQSRDNPKADWYVWNDDDQRWPEARIIFVDTEVSNWTFDAQREQYYWHRFFHHQPDLNYDNPEVAESMLDVVRYWLDLGLDGFRLDAVPYLFERDGTNGENLPETHEYLKRLRQTVDDEFPGRVLLAEANQWPSDVVEYFGEDGDECHMCFHFPLMPRMFMAVRREQRYPITEILAQTPAIPDGSQWGIFLRNHDELTLEMVSDDERDYMYTEYAKDPLMRRNIGISRRLFPLLDNDRRIAELFHAMLFSMPGSPVLYYGDEIGMGDNIYLGDRDGVRTPMQWTPDRNAGFSRADFAQLYLPPLMDPVYGYQAVNVEAETRNPSSFLHWLRRLIEVRREHPVFGIGSFEVLSAENPSVLAYIRRCVGDDGEEDIVLCAYNLSRFAQPVELMLAPFVDKVPIEMTGRVPFPAIGELPYFLTLPPYGFLWFSLVDSAMSAP